MKNIKRNVTDMFRALCQSVASEFNPVLGEDELEPLYEKLLDFIYEHNESHEELSQVLIKIIKGYRDSCDAKQKVLPITAIAYCMHELRWREIYAFAESENREFYSIKMDAFMTDIMDAYDDEWENKDFYRRYSSQE